VFTTLPDAISRALQARGYTDPTPVQEAVMAPETEGRDLLVSAKTGSGKTVAYGLAMAGDLLVDGMLPPADAPLALIIAPTRELALQVQTELTWLYAEAGVRVTACVGGMDPFKERRTLEHGTHIVVGTPGRLGDHLRRGALHLEGLKVLVLDEADEMLDLGFHDELEFLLQATPETRRTLLFSATMPKPIVTLAKNYTDNAMRIALANDVGGHADIEYRAIRTAHAKVDRTVVNLLRYLDPPSALVFCNTRLSVQKLGETLAARGFEAVVLSGEMTQAERNRALTALRDGRARVCVATDVAARGLDVPDLSLVIHADVPKDADTMQHRSGRTGRAGKKGTSILLVAPSRRRGTEQMMLRAGLQYEWTEAPTPEAIFKKDRERLLDSPIFANKSHEDTTIASALLERHSPYEIAAALAKLYREKLPEPFNVDEYVEAAPRAGREAYQPRPAREKRSSERSDDKGWRPHEPFEHQQVPSQRLPNGAMWYRISVGRERNADPKWLLPEICRQGDVTKKDIGEIRIFDTETRFELDAAMAEAFSAKIVDRTKGGVRIFPVNGGQPEFRPDAPAEEGERQDKPRFKPKFNKGDKPKGNFEHKRDFERKPKRDFERKGKPGYDPKDKPGYDPKDKPVFDKKASEKKKKKKKRDKKLAKHKKGVFEV
jgi:ATP-dependent RNA helicase DeaD